MEKLYIVEFEDDLGGIRKLGGFCNKIRVFKENKKGIKELLFKDGE
jgi:hypothetical protein